MKIRLDWDRRYSVFILPISETKRGKVVEMTEEEVKTFEKVYEVYWDIQDLLEKLYKETKCL